MSLRVGDPIADATLRLFGVVQSIEGPRAIVQFWRADDNPGPDGQRYGFFTASTRILEHARDALLAYAEDHP